VPQLKHAPSPYRFIQIGIECPDNELRTRIENRLDERLKKGMIAEVRALRSAPRPVSMKRLNELGLEYRYIALHLAGKLTKTEMRDQLATAIWQYARRQKTWFRRDKAITWFTRDEVAKIEKHIRAAF
jgi:tRNA dimethylallyltransferase